MGLGGADKRGSVRLIGADGEGLLFPGLAGGLEGVEFSSLALVAAGEAAFLKLEIALTRVRGDSALRRRWFPVYGYK